MTPTHGPLAAMYVAVNRTAGPGPSEGPARSTGWGSRSGAVTRRCLPRCRS
jgi:hypothetical protein